MNDIERLREAMRRELGEIEAPDAKPSLMKRARRRRAVSASGTGLAAVAVLGVFTLALGSLLPLGRTDKGLPTPAPAAAVPVTSRTCGDHPCIAFDSFPVGDLASCPAVAPDPQVIDKPGLIREVVLAAQTGSWPWEGTDPATQGLFSSEQDYRSLVSGQPFDVTVLSYDSAAPPYLRDLVAHSCGDAVAGGFLRVRVDIHRAGSSQLLYLVFVPNADGQARLWLALEPMAIVRGQQLVGSAAADVFGLKLVTDFPGTGCDRFVASEVARGYCLDSVNLSPAETDELAQYISGHVPTEAELTGQPLADSLGLVPQDGRGDVCQYYAVLPWSHGQGYCLDGHYTTDVDAWVLYERLRGYIPSEAETQQYAALHSNADARSQLPSGEEIGAIYGFPKGIHDTKDCYSFAEYDNPHGYCLDSFDGNGQEEVLLGKAITGQGMNAEEVRLVQEMLQLHQMVAADGETHASKALADSIAADVSAWWETHYGKSADDFGPTYGPCCGDVVPTPSPSPAPSA